MSLHFITKCNLILLLSLVMAVSAQETFMEMPSSVNVVVGTNATFNCSVRAHALAWFVNNEHVIAQHSTLRSISYTLHHNPLNNVLQSTLTVAANEINNMSMVHCEAYIFGDDENPARSDTAFLQIQDRLDAPRDLKVDLRVPGFILLFWSPPFTLDITGNDKDIVRYSVYVNGSETMMQENVTEGLVYIFLCSQNGSYYFSVSGFNLAGEGKRSDAVIGTCTEAPTCRSSSDGNRNQLIAAYIGWFFGGLLLGVIMILLAGYYRCWKRLSKKGTLPPTPHETIV